MGKRAGLLVVVGTLMFTLTGAVQAMSVKDVASGLKPEDLTQILAGSGVTITNVKLTGAPAAAGIFSGAAVDKLDMDSGVILSSGKATDAAGPNTSQNTTTAFNTPGDADLDKLVAPLKTHDAVLLEFDVVTAGSTFGIRYIFASEEYKEFVGSAFNDVFGFYVDGANIALVPGTNKPVSINTISHVTNTQYYRDNPPGTGNLNTSFDGLTTLLEATATVTPGETHHIKLAIADTSDAILDSAVFLEAGGITGTAQATLVVDPYNVFMDTGSSASVSLTAFGVPDNEEFVFSARGVSDDTVFTFKAGEPIGPKTKTATMTIVPGPTAMPGVYAVDVMALAPDSELHGTNLVTLDCVPPFIYALPADQPNSVTIVPGSAATLRVVPNGTGPYSCQWYTGHRGNTKFPIAGATSPQFTTPGLTAITEYWVRVSNACGSADSLSATVTPNGTR
jgi:Ig-like domain CHU_C associated